MQASLRRISHRLLKSGTVFLNGEANNGWHYLAY